MRIRKAETTDLEQISAIELDAQNLFSPEDIPLSIRTNVLSHRHIKASIREGLSWVAVGCDDKAIGFAITKAFAASLHVMEIGVLLSQARQGIGRALVSTILLHARKQEFTRVTLTTFKHLPWNAPFYRSCGFSIIDETSVTHRLKKALEEERALGLVNRVAMAIKI